MHLFLVVLSFLVVLKASKKCMIKSDIERMLVDIINNPAYDRKKIPPHGNNSSNPFPVAVDALIEYIHVYDQNELISTVITFRMAWMDARLQFRQYNPCERSCTLGASVIPLIWNPEIAVVNSKDMHIIRSPFQNQNLLAFGAGVVFFNFRASISTFCDFKLEKFPMDEQECVLIIRSVGYNKDLLYLRWIQEFHQFSRSGMSQNKFRLAFRDVLLLPKAKEPSTDVERLRVPVNVFQSEVKLHERIRNFTEYKMAHIFATNKIGSYPAGEWNELEIRFVMKRRFGWYLCNIYIPTYVIVFISWISFYLGCDAIRARTMIGVNALLVLTFHFGSMIRNLPRVSYIKAIDVWMLSGMLFVFGSLIELAVISWKSSQRKVAAKRRTGAAKRRRSYQASSTLLKTASVDTEEMEYFHTLTTPEKESRPGEQGIDQLDRISAIAFPVAYAVFNAAYWSYYLTLQRQSAGRFKEADDVML